MPHAVLNTPLGVISLFEDAEALVAIEWGRAPSNDVSPLLEKACAQLDAYFDGAPSSFDLPLRPPGTPFQRIVWEHLRRIPYGKTITYGQLANALNTAPRAVAAACGRNPIPIVVPCHRVVGANNWLGGYSGGDGVETKKTLLRLEGAAVSVNQDMQALDLFDPVTKA